MELSQRNSIGTAIVSVITFIILNLVILTIFGFLTIDSWANINSRVGAFILSFFLPFFIVYKTQEMSGLERLLKFGTGLMIYMISLSILAGFPHAFTSGLIPSITIALGMFYYGGKLLTTEE
jgi:hypothetical protein